MSPGIDEGRPGEGSGQLVERDNSNDATAGLPRRALSAGNAQIYYTPAAAKAVIQRLRRPVDRPVRVVVDNTTSLADIEVERLHEADDLIRITTEVETRRSQPDFVWPYGNPWSRGIAS